MVEETDQKCYLKNVDDPDSIINITEEISYVGRTLENKIQDVLCSRRQISLKADFKNYIVSVKYLGQNPSALNGCCLNRKTIYHAIHNDILDVVYTKLRYKVIFEPSPPIVKTNGDSNSSLSITDDKPQQMNSKDIQLKTEQSAASSSMASTSNTTKNNDEPMSKKFKLDTAVVNRNAKPTKQDYWEIVYFGKLLIFTSKGVTPSSKIASYDLDGTLITTKSGNIFPKDIYDWKIAFSEVPKKLKTQFADGYKIVLFTNQMNISKGKVKIEEFKQKMEQIQTKINVPMQVFVATSEGKFRKPMIGMWNFLCENKNNGVEINIKESFYVGDAAGRLENKLMNRKKDFATTDRLMAINLGLTFKTPEEHFMNAKSEKFQLPEFNPRIITDASNLLIPKNSKLISDKLEVIIMVGIPASGKSKFCKMYFERNGYVIVNQDKLHNRSKCIKVAEENLKKKINVVIDNTNPSPATRKTFIDIAKLYGANCRCFVMLTTYFHARHNNRFRELTDESHSKITDIVFNTYKKAFKEPTTSEGFSEIIKVNFIPKFDNKKDEEMYKMYLMDK